MWSWPSTNQEVCRFAFSVHWKAGEQLPVANRKCDERALRIFVASRIVRTGKREGTIVTPCRRKRTWHGH